ncbi:MAG: DUF5681 domain-containing protein [Fuscovulum sp.]|nr:MAG: DUF5681 domain-containing protein [Fuscovulum sp.]
MGDTPEPTDGPKVGYGVPPLEHQFKPGQSGNSKGRPRGIGNFKKLIVKHAAKKVTVLEGGVEKKMTKLDVVVAAMFNKAAKGDVAAARLLTSLILAETELSGDAYQSGYSDADLQVMLEEADWQAELVKLKQAKLQDEF